MRLPKKTSRSCMSQTQTRAVRKQIRSSPSGDATARKTSLSLTSGPSARVAPHTPGGRPLDHYQTFVTWEGTFGRKDRVGRWFKSPAYFRRLVLLDSASVVVGRSGAKRRNEPCAVIVRNAPPPVISQELLSQVVHDLSQHAAVASVWKGLVVFVVRDTPSISPGKVLS